MDEVSGLRAHISTIEEVNKALAQKLETVTKERDAALNGKDYWERQAENQLRRVREVHEAWEATKLQARELREELQHQKDLWVVALPQLHSLDDRAGIIRFGQLHDPMGNIDKTLGIEKRNCTLGPDHTEHDVNCGGRIS